MKTFSFLLVFLTFTFSLLTLNRVFAQTAENDIDIKAAVGEYNLDVSGYIAPFASVVLYSRNVYLRSTVANTRGDFSISKVLLREGTTQFCLQAVDYRRLGESYTCINIPPTKGPVEKRDIFLPPTIGLSRTIVAAGEDVLAFGYSMPGAEVDLKLSNGQVLSAFADESGYYEIRVPGLSAGTYTLFATATLQGKNSLEPSKKLTLKALSLWERIIESLKNFFYRIWQFFASIGLGILWLIIPILILIFILLYKLWPDRFWFILFWKKKKAG
ncbi:MAG: carboxypeptidase regulatory-like domain-containing protein [Candidatus Levybacteria bacterium]|nr:carboxypeptidase regulatory-like domain-containing protein [Candidatus Levybacteria bacterium]